MAALLCSSSALVKAHDHHCREEIQTIERQKEIIRVLREMNECLRKEIKHELHKNHPFYEFMKRLAELGC